ncbi:prepilin-type N-terminal cleavage/methylation domain-containing protein [Candidatus Saccharibacteria bacterium]|nr:prepilin-type N-terminal cleavage/methylation domain-containing protein [Candidatus Saccharibacteria bacterium]
MKVISNKQKVKSRLDKKTWLQSWMLKTARAFGLDTLQASSPSRNNWFQNWVPSASRAHLSDGQHQLPSRRFQVWMKHKAQLRNAVRRICNTLNEYRKLQRSDSPKPPAASMAVPLNRLAGPVRSGRGDTIVEVMISTAVLAIVLATAYTSSTHSLQSGLNAKYRDQALTYARAQIELIKTADNQRPPTVGAYKLNRPFCINPSDAKLQEVDSTTRVCSLPIGETNPDNQSPYSVVDNYSLASKTFTATVTWQSANNVPNQTTLYYKPNNSFVSGPGP